MNERGYDTEDLLQELLAKYPNLLAGDQIDDAAPRRWLLVSREMSLASEEDETGRWSVDHLFLDQDAIPTELRRIVEFLNQQMDPAEVLAVEIKQYASQDSNLKTLVPRVVGQTTA